MNMGSVHQHGHDANRHAGRHGRRRSPGAKCGRHATVGRRLERQSVPQRDGWKTGRRDHQRRQRRCTPLEGFGAKRGRNSPLDSGVHRPWHAPVGREVLRHALRPALGSAGRSGVSMAFRQPTVSAPRRRTWRASRVVWSPQTSSAIGNAKTEASQFGFYHALVEARIPFEMVNEQFARSREPRPL